MQEVILSAGEKGVKRIVFIVVINKYDHGAIL
jgi:hypothetical protein